MTEVVVLEAYAMASGARPNREVTSGRLSARQRSYLCRGLAEPGGKLPLFDREGQRYSKTTIESCLVNGWAEPWFSNPLQPNWLVCKLTDEGRKVAQEG